MNFLPARPHATAQALAAPSRQSASRLTAALLMTVALLLAAAVASAQSAFYLGANAGVNGSKLRFTEDLLELYPTSERLPGASVGLDAGFQVGAWSFATGLGYDQVGGSYQSDVYVANEAGDRAVLSARERMHVLTAPVTIGYSDYLTSRIGYQVAAGPSFRFGVTGRLDETTEYFESDAEDFQNYKLAFGDGVNDDYRGVQTSFRFTPSLFLDLTRNHRLSLNAVWDLGAKDAFNPKYKAANDFFRDYRGTVTVRSAALTVGYQYRIPFADRY